MKLVIAEKPSVAMSLAAVLGATERKDGYLEGSGYLVSWCVGHLLELAQPEAYKEQYAKWRYEDLPILPENWKYEVPKDKKKQLALLCRLMKDKRVDSVVCLKNNSILELFDALCSTDEVQRGKEYSDVFELAARKLGVAPEHCIVFDDVLPAIKSAKAARMLAGGIYDKYSADQRTEIERIADIYLLDFRQAPIPHKEV